jgi:hypothetical protein
MLLHIHSCTFFLTKSRCFATKILGGMMNRRISIPLIVIAGLVILSLVSIPVFAQETVKDILSKEYVKEKDICNVIKKTIKEGINTKDVTKTSIEMGHDACTVVKCAIDAGGNLQDIISGALEAGTTPDVCSRCAMDAGADPLEIAKALEQGLGYSPPVEAGLKTINIGLPGGDVSGGVISPSSF